MSNFFFRNPRLSLLAICLIIVSGLTSYFVLPRMEDPQLVKRGAFVNTAFPGAEPSRVETLVSEKIEDALNEIEEIKELRSSSREGISTILIELRDDVMDGDRVWTKIRDRLDDVQAELPRGALKPDFEEMDFKAYAKLIGLRWESTAPVNYAVLHRWAKQLDDRIKTIEGTEKTELFGQPKEEILVQVDPAKLTSLNLSIEDVARQISASDSKVSAGQLRNNEGDFLVEVEGELDSISRIQAIPIRYGGESGFVPLDNIASVERAVADPPESLAIIEGKSAIVVGVFVRPTVRIDRWSASVDEALDAFESELPGGLVLDRIFNQNDYVAHRLSSLVKNLLLGAAAVFLVIFLLMGMESAIVVSLALPLAAMMVLFGMRVMEIPVHQMSVTGLIIALGLLIDNAIVIVEETSIKLRQNMSPAKAVSESVRHLFFPLLGSTLTTALAFAPIALMPGPAGEFVGAIAINVIIAIFSSFFLAMTIIPAISTGIRMLRSKPADPTSSARKRHWWHDGVHNRPLANAYQRALELVLRRPTTGIFIGVALPIFGFVVATQLPEQFFPPSDRDQLHIELELSPFSSLSGTLETAAAIREELLQEPEVKRVDWFVGESAPAFYYNLIPRRSSVSQYAQAMVQLTTAENQAETIHRLQAKLDRKFAHARVLVRQLEQGPPFDAPVEVRLFGPDLDRLQQLGEQLREILVETPGVLHTRSEMDEVLPGISLDVQEESVRAAGMSLTDIARQLDAQTEGVIGGSIVEATEELPVRVRLGNQSRSSMEDIGSLNFVNTTTVSVDADRYSGVPLSAIADIRLTSEFGSITHLRGLRMNEIQVYIPAGMLPSTVLNAFKERLMERVAETDFELGTGSFGQPEIKPPPGYTLTYGGEAAKRNEAIGNLMANVGVLVVLMVATLVLSFGSFRMASIVGIVGMLSVGLGMAALWSFGFPFGFMAIVGTMGLMGVAINDTIVVLAAIRSDSLAASGDREAMKNVIQRSTRHIISTSLTTMAGFTPLILAGGGFWPPLAVAVAGGVGGATILALFFVPACYLLLMCPRKQEQVLAV